MEKINKKLFGLVIFSLVLLSSSSVSAGSLILSPSTGAATVDVIITQCTGCVDGNGFSEAFLYNGVGSPLGGSFLVDLVGSIPMNLDNSTLNSNGITGASGTFAHTYPLANGTYQMVIVPYTGGVYETSCNTSYTACSATGNASSASFTIGSTPPPPPPATIFFYPFGNSFTVASSSCSQTNFDHTATSSWTCNATSTQPTGVPYGDWLLMNSLLLFCLAFIPIRSLTNLFKFK